MPGNKEGSAGGIKVPFLRLPGCRAKYKFGYLENGTVYYSGIMPFVPEMDMVRQLVLPGN